MITIDSNGKATFHMYGVIGEDFWTGEGITAKGLSEALSYSGVEKGADLEVLIHSPGGDVFEGVAIKAILDEYTTKAVVMGLAASMASVIAVACDELEMVDGSELMLHNPWSGVQGEAKDLRAQADHLDQIKSSMIEIYSKRFDAEAVAGIMDSETWISASDAIEQGVADRIRKGKASTMAFVQNDAHSNSRYLVAAKADPRTAKIEEQVKAHIERISELEGEVSASKAIADEVTEKLATVEGSLLQLESEKGAVDKELSITKAKLESVENETARKIALSAHEPVVVSQDPEGEQTFRNKYDEYKSIEDRAERLNFYSKHKAEILRNQPKG